MANKERKQTVFWISNSSFAKMTNFPTCRAQMKKRRENGFLIFNKKEKSNSKGKYRVNKKRGSERVHIRCKKSSSEKRHFSPSVPV